MRALDDFPSDFLDATPGTSAAGFVVVDAGITDYGPMYETQKAMVERRKSGELNFDQLVFVEHPEVYTYGRKSPAPFGELDPLLSLPPHLPQFAVERGGEVTYHNVGQLVCYPILQLKDKERDLHLHLRRLESTLIDVLKDFGLVAERRPGATGVWISGKQKKIASIGVAVSGWVTYHGSALNVANDLKGFGRINPCGFDSRVMTSMEVELGGEAPSMLEVKESFLRHFSHHFSRFLVV